MITKKMTTFSSDTPLTWFKEEELQDTKGRGVETTPPSPHHAWGDLIMKGFAASRNSCFEITSVVSHFCSTTRSLPFLYMPSQTLYF